MKGLYVVYDLLAEAAVMLMEQPNDSCARRAATKIANDLGDDATSYVLIKVGNFNPDGPEISPCNETVCNLFDLVTAGGDENA